MQPDSFPDFLLLPEPIVFVDMETMGGTFGGDRITEIGIVEVRPAGVSQWTSPVNPGRTISAFIQQLTGITKEMGVRRAGVRGTCVRFARADKRPVFHRA